MISKMTDVANVRKGMTDMPYKGEHQTLIKQGSIPQMCSIASEISCTG